MKIFGDGEFKTAHEFQRILATFYFMLIGIISPFLFYALLKFYRVGGKFQDALLKEYQTTLLIVVAAEFVAILLAFRWFNKKVKVIRKIESLETRITAFFKLNRVYYFIIWIVALPLLPLYYMTAFMFFAGVYCLIIFVIMAIERPSSIRTAKVLGLRGDERKIIIDGLKLDGSDLPSVTEEDK